MTCTKDKAYADGDAKDWNGAVDGVLLVAKIATWSTLWN
jgi:hypothetical protein